MADVVLRDRVGTKYTYNDVDHIILKDKYDNDIVYSLEGKAYDYSYTVYNTNNISGEQL